MNNCNKKKISEFEQYLDRQLEEIRSRSLTSKEADHYSETIIDNIQDEYNLFGAEGTPKIAEKHIIDKISEIYDALLSNGLDVNSDSDENALNSCIWIENDDIAIMIAKKLLEHGADSNLKLTCEAGESLYDYLSFAVGYDMFGDNSFMRIWLMLIAYGGCDRNGNTGIVMLDGESSSIFKNIENYGFRVECQDDDWYIMHFYDIKTNKEVAFYEKLFRGIEY